jgi:hypothetical protein
MTNPWPHPVPLSADLVGTWELLSREDRTASGERRFEPGLGTDPIAWLMYDASGHFAAQFMKRDRSQIVEAPAGPAGANNTRSQGGYDAYFGTYTVDDASGEVTQTLVGALSAENVGHTVTREMTVVGDDLTIQLATTTVDGEAVTRTLRWRRIS